MFPPLSEKLLDHILTHLSDKEHFVFMETSKPSETDRQSLLFVDPIATLSCNYSDCCDIFFKKAQNYLNQGYFLAGWFAYEFGYLLEPVFTDFLKPPQPTFQCSNSIANRTLATLGVFKPPIIFNHQDGRFSPEPPFSEQQICLDLENKYTIANIRTSLSKKDYLKNLSRIKSYIKAGDTYQVNYTLKLLFDFSGSPESLYKTLHYNQPVAYSAYLKLANERIISFSPELFFKKLQSQCVVRPMKGTMSRGRTLTEDQQKADRLRNDPKNRSENVMIVDLLRNDLGRLSKMGSVKMNSMFDVETYATLHQMTSTISGQLRDGQGLSDLFQALFPCGSVTGAPKIRTMEIIHELEQQTRGVYTGGIGFFSPDGNATFNVPIRTIVINEGKGEMGIGAGIVDDSDPESEWQECLLKGQFLSRPKPDFQIIETILWEQDKGFWLFDKHLNRMASSAEYFGYPFNKKSIEERLYSSISSDSKNQPQRHRILLFRDGTIETSTIACDTAKSTTLISQEPKGSLPKIKISQQKTDSSTVALFHKTTMRQTYDSERQSALDAGYQEVFFVNENNNLTEGSISNIIIKKGAFYYTPPAKCGLLAGVFREYLLEQYPEILFKKLLSPEDLTDADAIYMANSVRGLVQVSL